MIYFKNTCVLIHTSDLKIHFKLCEIISSLYKIKDKIFYTEDKNISKNNKRHKKGYNMPTSIVDLTKLTSKDDLSPVLGGYWPGIQIYYPPIKFNPLDGTYETMEQAKV